MSWEEWKYATAVSILLAGVAFLPYLYGYLTAPAGKYYLGFVLNAKDQNTYFMWLGQVASGEVFLRNLFTSTEHSGAMFNLYFLLFGLPARLFGWSLDLCYQLARLISTALLGLASYAFAALLFPRGTKRLAAWMAILFAAGLGWLTSGLAYLQGETQLSLSAEEMLAKPVDTWIPEGFTWFSMLIMPHFAMALAFLLLTFRWTALGILENRLGSSSASALSLFALSFVHPYDVIVIYAVGFSGAVLLSWHRGAFSWQIWRHVVLIFALASPPILYNYLILNWNPGMSEWLRQNISDSPGPISYLLGFGLPLCLSIIWLVSFARRPSSWTTPWIFVWAWIVAAPFLLYAPVNFQRRLIVGLSAPLAAAMVNWLWDRTAGSRMATNSRILVLWAILGFASLTSLFHFGNAFRKVRDREGENYVSKAHVEILRELPSDERGRTILSSFETGNSIPRFSNRAVVVGSRGQTGNFDVILREVEDFYGGRMGKKDSAEFLQLHRVGEIYYGPAERRLDASGRLGERLVDLGWVPWLESSDGQIEIYHSLE